MSHDPLFLGLTRPSMILGVSYEAVLFSGMFTALMFLAVGNPFYLLVYAPMHGLSYLICMHDPRAFRFLALWFNTKGRANSRFQWKMSSSSPFRPTRRKIKGR